MVDEGLQGGVAYPEGLGYRSDGPAVCQEFQDGWQLLGVQSRGPALGPPFVCGGVHASLDLVWIVSFSYLPGEREVWEVVDSGELN